MSDGRYDVAIIGAGVNGAGIARDAALRGLRVIVFDKNDMCSATSAISSRLIHGGLRYLEYGEISLVYESLHERRNLRRIAAHLVQPLRISIPIFAGAKRGKWLIRLGMIAYDLLSFNKRLPRHEMLDEQEIRAAEPGLHADGLLGAARYYDAQVTFAERLVLENLLAARAAGAEIRTYCEVQKIEAKDGAVNSVHFHDGNNPHRIETRAVINAAGPWVDDVLAKAPGTTPKFIGGTKGSHIVVSAFAGAPKDAFYVEAAQDGRPIFIIPWYGQYLIGTTDIRYDDSLNRIRASRKEIDYLLDETNRVFPKADLDANDINYAYAGVRPLPRRTKGPESAITRRHIIKVNRQVASGMISIIGGKLTTYRNLAEQTVDRLARTMRWKLPECRTHDTLLPGAHGVDVANEALATSTLLSAAGNERLIAVYGGRVSALLDLAEREPGLQRCLDDDTRYLAAEVVFAIREEFAKTLTDIIFRRMMAGFDADQGRSIYHVVSQYAAAEFGWDDDETQRAIAELVDYADSLRVSPDS